MVGESKETSEPLNLNDAMATTIKRIEPNKIFLFNGDPSCMVAFDFSLTAGISGGVGSNPLLSDESSISDHLFAFILKYKITSNGIAAQRTVINLSTT